MIASTLTRPNRVKQLSVALLYFVCDDWRMWAVCCQRVCLHRVNSVVVITFFYVTVATHVTPRDVRVIETSISTIIQHSTYKSASTTRKSVLISSKTSPHSFRHRICKRNRRENEGQKSAVPHCLHCGHNPHAEETIPGSQSKGWSYCHQPRLTLLQCSRLVRGKTSD